MRRSGTEAVPGCIGKGADFSGTDFCVERTASTAGSVSGSIPLSNGGGGECEGPCNDDGDVSSVEFVFAIVLVSCLAV